MKLSIEELQNQKLRPETLEAAVQQVNINGYVLFENAINSKKINTIRTKFMKVFEAYIADNELNRGKNRTQMHLPFVEPFNDPDIITNPLALSVIDAILGTDCTCGYFASDTPLPGSEYQQVHSDLKSLYPEANITLPATGLVLNIPLVDFREDNGPVEIWPGGTHLIPEIANRQEQIQELAARMHSEPVLMPAGSLLIRDLRMWHRGTPNRSNAPRPNLALVYFRSWYDARPRIGIPQDTYDLLSERAKQLFRMEDIGGRPVHIEYV